MIVSYDAFIEAFLAKITEFEFLQMSDDDREHLVDRYLRGAIAAFRKNCKYALGASFNDSDRQFDIEIADDDVDEIVEIVSEGMVVQWLKPYARQQDLLQNTLNTRDFTQYSPSALLKQVTEAYTKAQKDFTQAIRGYSYNHGDLTSLHL